MKIADYAASAALAGALVLAAPALADCDGTGSCTVEGGAYRVAVPDGLGPHPALVFLHGFGGSGEAMVRQLGHVTERGYVLIAPDGLPREGDTRRRWSFHPDRPKQRDEVAFLRSVIADAVERLEVDPERVLLGGYSIGGSMVSYAACAAPDLATAYVPVAGSFWRPHPPLDACAGPVRLLHTHGWRDGTVPLEGRPLGSGVQQGDVFYGMQVWREVNGCDGLKATEFSTDEDFWVRRWTDCHAGALEFILHPGGHGIPPGWSDRALDWFEALPSE